MPKKGKTTSFFINRKGRYFLIPVEWFLRNLREKRLAIFGVIELRLVDALKPNMDLFHQESVIHLFLSRAVQRREAAMSHH